MLANCKCSTCLSYMFEWDPPLSSSTHVTCYKFHVQLEAMVVMCLILSEKRYRTMPGITGPSDYSKEPIRHPSLQINSKASSNSIFVIYWQIYLLFFNVSVNDGLPMKVVYRRTCLNLSIHNCNIISFYFEACMYVFYTYIYINNNNVWWDIWSVQVFWNYLLYLQEYNNRNQGLYCICHALRRFSRVVFIALYRPDLWLLKLYVMKMFRSLGRALEVSRSWLRWRPGKGAP